MVKVSKKLLYLGFILPSLVVSLIFLVIILFSTISEIYSGEHVITRYIFSITVLEAIWFIITSAIGMYLFILLFCGIQSIIYSFLMNYIIFPKVKSHFRIVLISGVLGGLSTTLPVLSLYFYSALFGMGDYPNLYTEILMLSPLFGFGFVIGLFSGYLLLKAYKSQEKALT
ncbi:MULTISPECIES: hypothetical protein [Acinetobacter]|uniref:hypothetical protein n=1 Tax=Acinetobacter TaxID=469 RepID=UPI00037BAD6B|nr:hypothetical protein [Acinetobacter haemolyticus]MCU4387942.1 hypothetical protein [Acinetobacter haemolyticus]NAR30025.1 hypothetical protein [Acinetobacter haemolyticus]NAR50231.1 hypothetical protein [Acinetobacter haemolyticus]NAR52913.1 hypothetical protein [Acinetobacter haemolyticus]NAR60241.1 hypothetical protein [Acinetobacter haemolyticus]